MLLSKKESDILSLAVSEQSVDEDGLTSQHTDVSWHSMLHSEAHISIMEHFFSIFFFRNNLDKLPVILRYGTYV